MSRDFAKQSISLEEAKARAISKLMGKKDKKQAPASIKQTSAPIEQPPQKKISLPPAETSYANRLKLNRNYEEYMRSFTNESPGVLKPLVPPPAPAKTEDLFAKDEEEERRKTIDRERLKRSLKLKDTDKFRKISASKSVFPEDEPIWCARCNTRHSPDFHKQLPKPRPAHVHSKPHYRVPSKREPEVIDVSSESDLSDFIVDEADEGMDARQVSSAIRKLTGYDPRKYRDDESDDDMEAGVEDILAEERRTARIGRHEDEEELRKLLKKSRSSA